MAFFDLPPPPGKPARSKAKKPAKKAKKTKRKARKVIVVVACSAGKVKLPKGKKVPAKDLYTSDLFKKARGYAERYGDGWVILSAAHGLVSPNQLLGDYNVRLRRGGDQAWAAIVDHQLKQAFDPATTKFVVLASADYRKHLFEPGSGLTYTEPMKGLGIGSQKKWLKERIS